MGFAFGLASARLPAQTSRMGTLYYGDNLDILRRYLKDESVDLVFLDPPFNSARITPVESAVRVQIVKDVKEGSSK